MRDTVFYISLRVNLKYSVSQSFSLMGTLVVSVVHECVQTVLFNELVCFLTKKELEVKIIKSELSVRTEFNHRKINNAQQSW